MSPAAPLRILRRASADQDIEAIIDDHLTEAGAEVALGFIHALEAAFQQLARQPAMGSPRYGEVLSLPGLRTWPLRRYPHIIFYFEAPDAIEIWRVLHGRRNIPVHLQTDC